MRARMLMAAAGVGALAAGCGSGNSDFGAAQAAFAKQGIQFKLALDADRLDAMSKLPKLDAGAEPPRFFAHTQSEAIAGRMGAFLFVMDDAQWASGIARYFRQGPKSPMLAILVTGNVVYLGANNAAARRAMNGLRK